MRIFNFDEFYNTVLSYETVFTKNVAVFDSKVIKTDNGQVEVDFTINYSGGTSFFLNFDEEEAISDISFEFFKNVIYNVYGVLADGTIEEILTDIDSGTTLSFSNNNDSLYKGLYVNSADSISQQLKDVKLFGYEVGNENESSDFYGYIVMKLDETEYLDKIIFASDSNTTLFSFNSSSINKLIKDINEMEHSELVNCYFNDASEIVKNKAIPTKDLDNVTYVVEIIDKLANDAKSLIVLGKEEKNEY